MHNDTQCFTPKWLWKYCLRQQTSNSFNQRLIHYCNNTIKLWRLLMSNISLYNKRNIILNIHLHYQCYCTSTFFPNFTLNDGLKFLKYSKKNHISSSKCKPSLSWMVINKLHKICNVPKLIVFKGLQRWEYTKSRISGLLDKWLGKEIFFFF